MCDYDFILQGKIACANVLSDLYAMGVSECDNMLMLLGVSNLLTQKQRDVVTPLVIKGFAGKSVIIKLSSRSLILLFFFKQISVKKLVVVVMVVNL